MEESGDLCPFTCGALNFNPASMRLGNGPAYCKPKAASSCTSVSCLINPVESLCKMRDMLQPSLDNIRYSLVVFNKKYLHCQILSKKKSSAI